jgi:hypothetical protein
VNDDVMVVPAQRCQVLRFVASAVGPRQDVVWLEPISGATPVDCATAVSPEDESSNRGWDRARPVGRDYRSAVAHSHDVDRAGAEDALERPRTDSQSVAGDLGARLASARCSKVSVDEYGHGGRPPRFRRFPVQ